MAASGFRLFSATPSQIKQFETQTYWFDDRNEGITTFNYILPDGNFIEGDLTIDGKSFRGWFDVTGTSLPNRPIKFFMDEGRTITVMFPNPKPTKKDPFKFFSTRGVIPDEENTLWLESETRRYAQEHGLVHGATYHILYTRRSDVLQRVLGRLHEQEYIYNETGFFQNQDQRVYITTTPIFKDTVGEYQRYLIQREPGDEDETLYAYVTLEVELLPAMAPREDAAAMAPREDAAAIAPREDAAAMAPREDVVEAIAEPQEADVEAVVAEEPRDAEAEMAPRDAEAEMAPRDADAAMAPRDAEEAMVAGDYVEADELCAQCGNVAEFQCRRCKEALYCSKACQRQHWRKQHQYNCVLWADGGKKRTRRN